MTDEFFDSSQRRTHVIAVPLYPDREKIKDLFSGGPNGGSQEIPVLRGQIERPGAYRPIRANQNEEPSFVVPADPRGPRNEVVDGLPAHFGNNGKIGPHIRQVRVFTLETVRAIPYHQTHNHRPDTTSLESVATSLLAHLYPCA